MKISIITCTLNNSPYLEKNIESVLSQTYHDFEHIFIDGFSTDGTTETIKEYQKKYPSKVLLFQSEPKGISDAMNKGILNAKGEYIIHLHSDDSFFDSNVLKDVYDFLKNSNYPDWIYGKINVIEKQTAKGIFPTKKMWQNSNNSLFKKYLLKFFNYIPHQAVFIKKDIFKKFGNFNENFKTCMDYEFWLRIKNKTTWIFFDRIISNYSLREDAQSSSTKNKILNETEIMNLQKKHMNKIEILNLYFLKKILSFKKTNYQK